MRLKIISDGTPQATSVTNAETGEVIDGVTAISWFINASQKCLAQCQLTVLADVDMDVIGEAVDETSNP